MKNTHVFLRLFFVFCILLLTIGARAVRAAEKCDITTDSSGLKTYNCSFDNPVTGGNSGSLADLIQFVVDKLQPIAFMIAALIILIAGFRYVVAVTGGQADLAGKAKELFVPAIEGALIIVAGATIVNAVVEFVKKF